MRADNTLSGSMSEEKIAPIADALVPLDATLATRYEAQLARMRHASASELAEMYEGAYAEVAKLANLAAEHRDRMRLVERVYAERLESRKSTVLPSGSPSLSIELQPGARMEPIKNLPLLREKLEALVLDGERLDPKVIEEIVHWETPDPILKSNLAKLNTLVKEWGEPVAAIKATCIEDRKGPPRLVVSIRAPEQP